MIVLELDDQVAKDLFAHLHEAGEHIAAGAPMGPMTLSELRNVSWVYETLNKKIQELKADESKSVV